MDEKLPPKQIELYAGIDEILWKDWDPIGINEDESARDEYYSYLPLIFDMTLANANEQKIAEYLYKSVTENMGLSSSIESNMNVARKIVELKTRIGF